MGRKRGWSRKLGYTEARKRDNALLKLDEAKKHFNRVDRALATLQTKRLTGDGVVNFAAIANGALKDAYIAMLEAYAELQAMEAQTGLLEEE